MLHSCISKIVLNKFFVFGIKQRSSLLWFVSWLSHSNAVCLLNIIIAFRILFQGFVLILVVFHAYKKGFLRNMRLT